MRKRARRRARCPILRPSRSRSCARIVCSSLSPRRGLALALANRCYPTAERHRGASARGSFARRASRLRSANGLTDRGALLMRVGLQVPNFTWPGGPKQIAVKLAEIAGAAERAGFYSLWVMDHFFQIRSVGPHENDMLEGYTTLGYLAALTARVKLGTMATGVIYRYPGILVKTATTLDVLSGGRTYFAIGAAWNEQESRGLGVPFPPIAVRFELLEEALQIAKQMWSADNGPYRGKHNQLEETLCVPQPLSRPHPPVLVAGSGEKKTLRLVAQYADACNLFGTPEIV